MLALLCQASATASCADREPLPTKGGGVLRTIKDAYDYFEALPLHRASRPHWQSASAAILEEADVAEVTGGVSLSSPWCLTMSLILIA